MILREDKKDKTLTILLLCLKILLLLLVVIPLVFFSYRLIEGRIEDLENIGNDSYHSGTGLYIFLTHMVLLVVNAVLAVIGVIGFVVANRKRAYATQQKIVRMFLFLTIAPMCSQLLYTIITAVVMHIG